MWAGLPNFLAIYLWTGGGTRPTRQRCETRLSCPILSAPSLASYQVWSPSVRLSFPAIRSSRRTMRCGKFLAGGCCGPAVRCSVPSFAEVFDRARSPLAERTNYMRCSTASTVQSPALPTTTLTMVCGIVHSAYCIQYSIYRSLDGYRTAHVIFSSCMRCARKTSSHTSRPISQTHAPTRGLFPHLHLARALHARPTDPASPGLA